MSKIVTQRLDYAIYDDAAGLLTAVPPTYPPTIDQYSTQSIGSAASGYGVYNLTGAGTGQTYNFVLPLGANLVMTCPTTNTLPTALNFGGFTYTPGGAITNSVGFYCAPGQTISIPGPMWKLTNATGQATTISAYPVTAAGVQSLTTTFSAQILWSW